jgi:hypothetical protein
MPVTQLILYYLQHKNIVDHSREEFTDEARARTAAAIISTTSSSPRGCLPLSKFRIAS